MENYLRGIPEAIAYKNAKPGEDEFLNKDGVCAERY